MKKIETYIELVFPIIQHCAIESLKKDFQKNHIWYLNRQIFYGFGDFEIKSDEKVYHSENALNCFEELNNKYKQECESLNKKPKELKISTLTWHEQPLIDPGRKHLLFEHMYTGTMFREDVISLHISGNLSSQSLLTLVQEKFMVCLITKDENKKLHKTQRGTDPLDYYEKQGIKIINI
jgi:hypothetical protein